MIIKDYDIKTKRVVRGSYPSNDNDIKTKRVVSGSGTQGRTLPRLADIALAMKFKIYCKILWPM